MDLKKISLKAAQPVFPEPDATTHNFGVLEARILLLGTEVERLREENKNLSERISSVSNTVQATANY